MSYIITINGTPRRLPYNKPFRDGAGTLHPWSVTKVWSEADLAAIGVTRADPPVVEASPIDLPALKADLKRDIDQQAEDERARYITPGSGQALTYSHKAQEAARYLLDTNPDAADYPLLSAEVGITGETLHQVAQIVAHMHAQWQLVGGAIERARLAAKAAVDAAEDEAAARAVVPTWP